MKTECTHRKDWGKKNPKRHSHAGSRPGPVENHSAGRARNSIGSSSLFTNEEKPYSLGIKGKQLRTAVPMALVNSTDRIDQD